MSHASAVEAVLFAALEKETAAERTAYLDSACAGDADLRRQVEKLLQAHANVGDFLQKPVGEQLAAAPALGDATQEIDASTDGPGAVPAGRTGLFLARTEDGGACDEGSALDFLQPSTRPDSLGQLGHYEVLEVLGQGGFGIVFRAFDEQLQRVVAIKVLAPAVAASSPARKRFLREARSSARVRHENVVQVYAVEEEPLPYLVMEFVPGETLQQRLDRTSPLEVTEVVQLGRQLAEGLAAAHDQGLIHRDIKPGNILIEAGPNQHARITDFGLARAADDASLSQSRVVAGTPMFMAPEQASEDALDHRADLFSLGSVLYTICSGRPPFRAPSTLAVLKRIVEDTPRPIREIIPEVPQWLCNLIAKLHAKKPDDRFATAREVADLLGRGLAALQSPGSVKPPSVAAPAAVPKTPQSQETPDATQTIKPRFRIRRWAAAAAMLLALLGGLGFAEATGVTNVRGAVIRLFSPKGTLVDGSEQVSQDPADTKVAGAGGKGPDSKAVKEPTDAWERSVATMPAEEQVKAVAARLKELNPGFDGKVRPTIKDGVVTNLRFNGTVTDLSPLRGMKLTKLYLINNSRVTDLTPLRGMPLEELTVWPFLGSDLAPLKGMHLKSLTCGGGGREIDLTPLAGMPLEYLRINISQISDLTPLKGMPLKTLECSNTPVADLVPLRGMPLHYLQIFNTKVSDLVPIQGMPLDRMGIHGTSVTDLSPLKGMQLKDIRLTPKNITRGLDILRDMKSLKIIGIDSNQSWPAAEFWYLYNRGELTK